MSQEIESTGQVTNGTEYTVTAYKVKVNGSYYGYYDTPEAAIASRETKSYGPNAQVVRIDHKVVNTVTYTEEIIA